MTVISRPRQSSLSRPWIYGLILLIVLANVYRLQTMPDPTGPSLLDSVREGDERTSTTDSTPPSSKVVNYQREKYPTRNKREREKTAHQIAGLDCSLYTGGPPNKVAQEMIYWKDKPEDAYYVSQFATKEEKYLTFEPDEGGFNNIRMAYETAVTMALAMGRTLVLPPSQELYLLWKNDRNQKKTFGFRDFYHLDSIEAEHRTGWKILNFDDFLKREAMTGRLIDRDTGRVTFPPNNRTNWNGASKNWHSTKTGESKTLWQWVRRATTPLDWNYDECVAAFPDSPSTQSLVELNNTFQAVLQRDIERFQRGPLPRYRQRIYSYRGNPTPVNATPVERLAELLSDRKEMCVYDKAAQAARVIHLKGEQSSGSRLLVHFYAFLFFQNWKHELWTKRFVRDHLRYHDEIQCAAARVVQAVREKSKVHGNAQGRYDSMHVRRGDFQYKPMHMSSRDLYQNNTKDMLQDGRTVFIATDERDANYFEIFREHYHVYFLHDFEHLLEGVNTNFYGMIDQLVASRGDTFVGAYFSTFTGYINRIRGYHAQNDKVSGYEYGFIDSYFYAPDQMAHVRKAMRKYEAIIPPIWAREWPTAWRDIDHATFPVV